VAAGWRAAVETRQAAEKGVDGGGIGEDDISEGPAGGDEDGKGRRVEEIYDEIEKLCWEMEQRHLGARRSSATALQRHIYLWYLGACGGAGADMSGEHGC